MTSPRLASALPLLLSLNAGYVDTADFLALQGLFTAHVTGNFVTLGASLVLGISGAVAKLLALPVFCVGVIATRLLSTPLMRRGFPALKILLALKVALLALGAALAIHFGPFANGDTWQAVSTGMVLVAAMSIQNAVQRINLASAPPTTLMTGTTTQIMIDLADMMQQPRAEATEGARSRLVRMSTNLESFALGCGSAALLYAQFGVKCFLLPPMVALFLRVTVKEVAVV